MPISKDPADYQYAPPPERTRRVGKLLRVGFRVFGTVGFLLLTLHILDLI